MNIMNAGRWLPNVLSSFQPIIRRIPYPFLTPSAGKHLAHDTWGIPKTLVHFMPVPDHIRRRVNETYPVDTSRHRQQNETYELSWLATRPYACRIERHNTYYNKNYVISSGSGFVFHADGYIATSTLVVGNLPTCRVILNDGQKYEGSVEWFNDSINLAIVRIKERDLQPIPMSVSRDGQVVAVCGTPESQHLLPDPETGVKPFFPAISATAEWDWLDRTQRQIAEPENYGHVGGAVVNRFAEAVGVCHINPKYEPLAVPIEFVKYYMMMKPLKSFIRKNRLYGLLVFQLTTHFHADFDLPFRHFGAGASGVVVVRVCEGYPAYEAGLRHNDVITRVNGRAATSNLLGDALINLPDVTLSVKRKGETLDISMPASKWPNVEDVTWI